MNATTWNGMRNGALVAALVLSTMALIVAPKDRTMTVADCRETGAFCTLEIEAQQNLVDALASIATWAAVAAFVFLVVGLVCHLVGRRASHGAETGGRDASSTGTTQA